MAQRLVQNITAQGTEYENSTTQTVLNGTSFSMPAGWWQDGKELHFRILIKVLDNNSTDTLTPIVYFGPTTLTTAIATFGAVNVADGDHAWITGVIQCRDADSSGTYVAVVEGADLAASGGGTRETHHAVTGSIDFTAALLLEVGVTWSVAHADNECVCEFASFYEVTPDL